MEAAQSLSYTANSFARGLSKQESHLVGLLVPNISEPYFLEIARGAEEVFSRRGYLVVLCNTDREPELERKYLEELRGMRSGAILIGRTGYAEDLVEAIASHPAPVVTIGGELPCPSVQVDNVGGAIAATDHLIELGHRLIAFIGGSPTSLSGAERLEGFRLAMNRHNVPVDGRLVVAGGFSVAGGAAAMSEILSITTSPDAVFAANDQMAIGVMHEAIEHGLRVPDDLSVVGFNDTPISAYLNPSLTTVRIPLRMTGEAAAELLLKQMESQSRDGTTITVTGELVVRRSTAPRPSR